MASGAAIAQHKNSVSPPASPVVQRGWLGRAAMATFFGWIVVHLLLCLVPLRWFHVFPVQAARRPTGLKPFIPNLTIYDEKPIGELAVTANLAPLEPRHPVTFATDQIGFRATPGAVEGTPPQVIVFEGDSFTFGAGLDQEETLPARLSRKLSTGVYNAGRFADEPEEAKQFRWLKDRLQVRDPTVVYVFIERTDPWHRRAGRAAAVLHKWLGPDNYSTGKEIFSLVKFYNPWNYRAPLKILATRWYKQLLNDRVLPNEYKHRLEIRQLADGRRILLEPHDIDRYRNPPDEEKLRTAAAFLMEQNEWLQKEGAHVLFLLVPERYSVYGPWIPGETQVHAPGTAYLDRLEQALTTQGVPVVNGLAILRSSAERDIAEGHLSYHLEDHHWNRQGVERISQAVAARLRDKATFGLSGRETAHALQ